MNIIDSHVHLYDPARPDELDWPAADSPLRKKGLKQQLTSLAETDGLSGVVAVETSRRPNDDEWLLDLAGREPVVRAVVLNLQPDQPDFAARLRVASAEPSFRGVRLRPIVDYDLASPILFANIGKLSERGFSVEFGAPTRALRLVFAEMASTHSTSHWILDHCGHPEERSGAVARAWRDDMGRISEAPNVFVKVTDSFQRYMPELIRLFGIDRLLFGSNWPVSSLTRDYATTLKLFERQLSRSEDREAFLSLNAERAYRLTGS